jgi:hypothetical protein
MVERFVTSYHVMSRVSSILRRLVGLTFRPGRSPADVFDYPGKFIGVGKRFAHRPECTRAHSGLLATATYYSRSSMPGDRTGKATQDTVTSRQPCHEICRLMICFFLIVCMLRFMMTQTARTERAAHFRVLIVHRS